jgi:D-tyrosyl-tRNA(Tyr) deacylase
LRAVATRVLSASVELRDGPASGQRRAIGPGLLILLGVGKADGEAQAKKLVEKLLALRIFPDDAGRFDRSIADVSGSVLLVSQFTLYGSLKGGRRPDFGDAARPEAAQPLYRRVAELLRGSGLTLETGEFGASMAVASVNDGPVTLWLDTDGF